jgi:hypothetical protein
MGISAIFVVQNLGNSVRDQAASILEKTAVCKIVWQAARVSVFVIPPEGGALPCSRPARCALRAILMCFHATARQFGRRRRGNSLREFRRVGKFLIREIPAAMENSENLDFVGMNSVKQQMIPCQKGSQVGGNFISHSAEFRKFKQLHGAFPQVIDIMIGGQRVVLGDILPGFQKVFLSAP